MKKVLLISTQYPTPGAGTRTAGLVKYLPTFGWEVTMITPSMPRLIKAGRNVVETPAGDYISAIKARLGVRPGESVTQRMGAPGGPNADPAATASVVLALKSVLAYPDERRGWIRPAIRAANELFPSATSRPTALLSTSPAVSGHVVADRLARHWRTPWVADLRDLWTGNPYHRQIRLRELLDARLERRTLDRAQSLSTVSEELAAALNRRHGSEVAVITNGFDPDELRPDTSSTNAIFTITHTGGMYGGKRDPSALLLAMRQMIDVGELNEHAVQVNFFGPREVWLDGMIRKMRLDACVRQNDYVNPKQAIAAQRASHLLLLLTWDDPADRGTCPVKLFEYMAARRPILALGYRDSAGSRIVEDCGLGRAFASDDVAGVRGYLQEAVRTAARIDPQVDLDPASARRYSQVEMARKFAGLLDEVSVSV